MSRTLIILPDESAKPITDAIAAAKQLLRVKMFVFSDPRLMGAVIDAHRRGIRVQVMLNAARRSGEDDNKESRQALIREGIEVKDSNPEFGVTHEKSMIVDDTTAFVKSLNWETKNFTETRDYAIATSHAKEVEAVVAGFQADWHRQEFKPAEDARLIWCPNDGRERIAHFIDEAKNNLFVQNERYQDAVIIERLVRARVRGVKIQVMAPAPHSLKKDKLIEGVGGLRIMNDVKIDIHKLKHLKLHGKMLLADGKRAILGSINLAPGSFDDRRELAIEIHDDHIVERLQKMAHHDWKNSHPLDLTDEGLLADLEKRVHDCDDMLVLDSKKEHKH